MHTAHIRLVPTPTPIRVGDKKVGTTEFRLFGNNSLVIIVCVRLFAIIAGILIPSLVPRPPSTLQGGAGNEINLYQTQTVYNQTAATTWQ